MKVIVIIHILIFITTSFLFNIFDKYFFTFDEEHLFDCYKSYDQKIDIQTDELSGIIQFNQNQPNDLQYQYMCYWRDIVG